jgi:hypothetical protein
MGNAAEAKAAMDQVYTAMDQLPAAVTSDDTSMFGWPEYRLRHGESLVATYLGDQARASTAQERALALYPPHMFRERAQVELHHALGLARSGEGTAGATHAHRVIEELPENHRIEVVLEVARSVVRSVPQRDRQQREVEALRQLVYPASSATRAIGPA